MSSDVQDIPMSVTKRMAELMFPESQHTRPLTPMMYQMAHSALLSIQADPEMVRTITAAVSGPVEQRVSVLRSDLELIRDYWYFEIGSMDAGFDYANVERDQEVHARLRVALEQVKPA